MELLRARAARNRPGPVPPAVPEPLASTFEIVKIQRTVPRAESPRKGPPGGLDAGFGSGPLLVLPATAGRQPPPGARAGGEYLRHLRRGVRRRAGRPRDPAGSRAQRGAARALARRRAAGAATGSAGAGARGL